MLGGSETRCEGPNGTGVLNGEEGGRLNRRRNHGVYANDSSQNPNYIDPKGRKSARSVLQWQEIVNDAGVTPCERFPLLESGEFRADMVADGRLLDLVSRLYQELKSCYEEKVRWEQRCAEMEHTLEEYGNLEARRRCTERMVEDTIHFFHPIVQTWESNLAQTTQSYTELVEMKDRLECLLEGAQPVQSCGHDMVRDLSGPDTGYQGGFEDGGPVDQPSHDQDCGTSARAVIAVKDLRVGKEETSDHVMFVVDVQATGNALDNQHREIHSGIYVLQIELVRRLETLLNLKVENVGNIARKFEYPLTFAREDILACTPESLKRSIESELSSHSVHGYRLVNLIDLKVLMDTLRKKMKASSQKKRQLNILQSYLNKEHLNSQLTVCPEGQSVIYALQGAPDSSCASGA